MISPFALQTITIASMMSIWGKGESQTGGRVSPLHYHGVRYKEYHTPRRVLVGCSSPLPRPSARRWINHLSLWRMANAMSDLRLPSQSQNIAAPRLASNYTAWWQRHVCMNNLLAESGSAGSWTSRVASQRLNRCTARPTGVPLHEEIPNMEPFCFMWSRQVHMNDGFRLNSYDDWDSLQGIPECYIGATVPSNFIAIRLIFVAQK